MADTVWLQRPTSEVPWGFRLTGGIDQNQPLTVQRVTAGSIAATGLNKGDVIYQIGDTNTTNLSNAQANEVIKKCGNLLQLHIANKGVSSSPGAPPPMQQQPTRLAQQLSNMSTGSQRPGGGPYSSNSPSSAGVPNASHSPSTGVQYPFANVQPPAPVSAPGGPGAPTYVGPSNQNQESPTSPNKSPGMPDAVLNMAARGPPEKKPWAYAPDMDSIKNQRDKVRKKPQAALPRYQHMLNMPDFSDPPKVVTPTSPPTQSQPHNPADKVNEDGMYVHAQYNSPLQLYSDDNVQEAFTGQTDGAITGAKAGAPKGQSKDVVMSPTYRMIHGLDPVKPKPKIYTPEETAEQSYDPSGNTLGVEEVGNYNEASIRYKGKNIPSKSFRMLQSMTGGPNDNVQDSPRPRQTPNVNVNPPSPPPQNPDEVVDIRFAGHNIPSRSFRMLQHSVGDDQASSSQPAEAPRSVRVIKLRSQAPARREEDNLATDF